jgi:ComF family protein
VCAVDYAFPWDRLILDLKFHGQAELSVPLSELLVSALRRTGAENGVELLLPIPLSPARLAERGYNQAWEIARRVAFRLELPAHAGWLQRPVDSAHQADLPREARAVNLRGAFMVHPRDQHRLAGRHVALVDDVMTTGATAREATTAVMRAGAASVVFWSVARTP